MSKHYICNIQDRAQDCPWAIQKKQYMLSLAQLGFGLAALCAAALQTYQSSFIGVLKLASAERNSSRMEPGSYSSRKTIHSHKTSAKADIKACQTTLLMVVISESVVFNPKSAASERWPVCIFLFCSFTDCRITDKIYFWLMALNHA